MSLAVTLASFKVTVTVITVLLMAYFLSSPTVMVIWAVPAFIAVTVPLSLIETTPDSSGIKLTFNPSGVVVYSIVPFSPAFSSMSLAVTLASFKVTVTVITVELIAYFLPSPTNTVT